MCHLPDIMNQILTYRVIMKLLITAFKTD